MPAEIAVKRPDWPRFTPGAQPAPANFRPLAGVQPAPATAPTPAAHPHHENPLNEARLEAARVLQEAAAEAEAAIEAARQVGFEQGREEGIEAGKAELENLRSHAHLEVENARLQAANIRQQAEAEAGQLRAQAEREAQEILLAAREEARRIMEEGRAEARQRLDQSGDALVELAVAAATQIVQGHLALHPESITRMVAVGLRRLKDTDCTVRISPEDLPLLEAQRATLERELGAGTLQIAPDPGLRRGSYLVTSPQGQVDGTLEQQAERMHAALDAALGGTKS